MKRAWILLVLAACHDSEEDSAQKLCIDDVNMYRSMEGLDPVERSSELQAYASEGAEVDFGSVPFMHFGTDGGGVAAAEDQCPQQDGWTVDAGEDQKTLVSQCVRSFYEEGPGTGGHYEILLGPYTRAGCGIFQQDTMITIIVDFGD
jgi:hypothetical protein